MGWEGAGLPKGGGMQFLFEGFGGEGGVVSASLNNHIASKKFIQFHSPVLPKIITQWR